MAETHIRERRRFPRPPLWLNLLLVIVALATFTFAQYQRNEIDAKTALLFTPSKSNPAELNQVRDELSQMDVTEDQLKRELDARLEYLKTIDSAQFYLTIDSARKKLDLRLGEDVVRETDIEIGNVAAKGAFTVSDKRTDHGTYLIILPDNYLISSPPPRPDAIMVPEPDLAAMWPRIVPRQTRVYIF